MRIFSCLFFGIALISYPVFADGFTPIVNPPIHLPITVQPIKEHPSSTAKPLNIKNIPVIQNPYTFNVTPITKIGIIKELKVLPVHRRTPESEFTAYQFNKDGDISGSFNIKVKDFTQGLNDRLALLQGNYKLFLSSRPALKDAKIMTTSTTDPTTGTVTRKVTLPASINDLSLIHRKWQFGDMYLQKSEPKVDLADRQFNYNCPTVGDKWGGDTFGVEYSANCRVAVGNNVTGHQALVKSDLNVNALLLSTSKPIVKFDSVASTSVNTPNVDPTGLSMYILNEEIVNTKSKNEKKSAFLDRSISHSGYYPIYGPVGLSYKVAVGGVVGVDYDIQVTDVNKSVNSSVRPYGNLYGDAYGGISVSIAGGGVYGHLKALEISIPTTGNVYIDSRKDLLSAKIKSDFTYQALAGELGLELWYDVWLSSDSWRIPLWSGEGWKGGSNIAEENYMIPLKDYIGAKWKMLGGENGYGSRLTDDLSFDSAQGMYANFSNGGQIIYHKSVGTWEVRGLIRERYELLGGWKSNSLLGYPLSDEKSTSDLVGRYNKFQGGFIYWHPNTGAHEMHGDILGKWMQIGAERNLGYPLTDEKSTKDGVGRFNHFQRGSIYWHPQFGAHPIRGFIRNRWADLGFENGLGYSITDELYATDNVGRYNQFSSGDYIYWHPNAGAHKIRATLHTFWKNMGGESSCLGYPIEEEVFSVIVIADGVTKRREFNQNFSGGNVYINWSSVDPKVGDYKVNCKPQQPLLSGNIFR